MKFDTKTYRGKVNLMVFGSIILLVFSYFLVIKKTIAVGMLKSDLVLKSHDLTNAPTEYEFYKARLEEMNENLGYLSSEDIGAQEMIMDYLGAFSDSTEVFLKQMPKTSIIEMNGYQVETNVLHLEGHYSNLVWLMYLLENKYTISKISSANFFVFKDISTKKKSLVLEVHLQNIVL